VRSIKLVLKVPAAQAEQPMEAETAAFVPKEPAAHAEHPVEELE